MARWDDNVEISIDVSGKKEGEHTRMNHRFGGPSRNLAGFDPVRFVE